MDLPDDMTITELAKLFQDIPELWELSRYAIGRDVNLNLIDAKEDIVDEALGYQYAVTGVWSDGLSDSFLLAHPEIERALR